jgi:uncharacterized protein YybS (DUF2232 family)
VAAGLGAALLFGSALLLPWLFFVAIVSPLPLMVHRLRGGLGNALMAVVLAAALVAGVFSPALSGVFLLCLVAPGLLVAEGLARGRGLLRGCGWAFALLSAEIAAALVFANAAMEARVLEPLSLYARPPFVDELRSSGLPAEQVTAWVEQMSTLLKVMKVVYPGFYFIVGALLVLAHTALLRVYLARSDPGWLESGEFEEIRWPMALPVAFVAGGAAVALPALRPAGYNVLLVLAFFFVLQGLAVVAFYAHRLAGPPLLRGAVVVLVLVNPWAPYILALLGLFDTWVDFRKWARPPAED